MEPGVDGATDDVEPIEWVRWTLREEGQELVLVAFPPRAWIEGDEPGHRAASRSRSSPVLANPASPSSCTLSVVAPSAVRR